MPKYKIKPINEAVVHELEKALREYKEKTKISSSYSDIKPEHDNLVLKFSELIDARNVAINDAIPKINIKNIELFSNCKITIILDAKIEKLLNDVCKTLSKGKKGNFKTKKEKRL